jgi:hypothetical protein
MSDFDISDDDDGDLYDSDEEYFAAILSKEDRKHAEYLSMVQEHQDSEDMEQIS